MARRKSRTNSDNQNSSQGFQLPPELFGAIISAWVVIIVPLVQSLTSRDYLSGLLYVLVALAVSISAWLLVKRNNRR